MQYGSVRYNCPYIHAINYYHEDHQDCVVYFSKALCWGTWGIFIFITFTTSFVKQPLCLIIDIQTTYIPCKFLNSEFLTRPLVMLLIYVRNFLCRRTVHPWMILRYGLKKRSLFLVAVFPRNLLNQSLGN